MNSLKYRDTSDFREILRLFQKSSEGEDNLLWQNIAGQRVLYPVTHLEIDFVGREVVVYLEKQMEIKAEAAIYFKLSYHNTIFKQPEFLVQADCVSFKFPHTMKTWDLRSNERYCLDSAEEYSAVISASSHMEVHQQLKVALNDFSACGLGLSISEVNKHIIKNHKTFWVHSINDFRFKNPIAADVMYLSKEHKTKKYRFGMNLAQRLPIDAVKSIIG